MYYKKSSMGFVHGGLKSTFIKGRQQQNGRLFASFNFFRFLLIKSRGTSNYISDQAAPTDEFKPSPFTH